MTKPVTLSHEAISDLDDIFEWIADAAGTSIAQAYVDGLKAYCLSFALFPERGTLRPHLHAGLRTIGFRRQVTIVFTVQNNDVMILRIARRGRDIDAMFPLTKTDNNAHQRPHLTDLP